MLACAASSEVRRFAEAIKEGERGVAIFIQLRFVSCSFVATWTAQLVLLGCQEVSAVLYLQLKRAAPAHVRRVSSII